jgi:hypothetical protein
MHRAAAHSDERGELWCVGLRLGYSEEDGTSDRSTPNAIRVLECFDRVFEPCVAFWQLAAVTVAISIRMPRSYQPLVHQQVHPSRGPTSYKYFSTNEMKKHTCAITLTRLLHHPSPTRQTTTSSTAAHKPQEHEP